MARRRNSMTRTMGGVPDIATMSDGLAGPGMDTRQWLSYGLVLPDAGDAHSVRFKDEDGAPIPQGALVDVKLEPSGIVVPCRVLSRYAGAGEGSWSPIGPGDEVLVAVPEGDERAGCVILGKLSNGPDVFPTTVAGQDVTQNTIGFDRSVTPYIFETAASYMVRAASTGASWSIDATGNVIFNDGSGNSLSLTHTAIVLQESTNTALLQIDPAKLQVTLQADSTTLTIDALHSKFMSTGDFSIASGGFNPIYHLATVESVINLLINFFIGLGAILPAPIPISTILSAVAIPGINACADATLGVLSPAVIAAIAATFIKQTTPTNAYGAFAVADLTGIYPGIGRPSLLVG